MGKLLVIDDDELVRRVLVTALSRVGHVVLQAADCAEARGVLQSDSFDLAIIDYQLPDGTAFDVLSSMRQHDPDASAIVLTGLGTIELAVRAIKAGAEHFLTKPVDFESLHILVRRTLEAQQGRRRAREKSGHPLRNPFIGESRAMAELEHLARAASGSEAPVLILGETGSGKGVLARFLHDEGPRKAHPFVDLNCAGFSRELVESELFGHQRGAFTGAVANKIGLLEAADQGTLFLDELGDLDLSVQPKLLKVIEEKSFRRIGELSPRTTDVRLIAATHRNLHALVQRESFREDLLFRVNTLTLEIPPLRERTEDIPALARAVLGEICAQAGRPEPEITPAALSLLCQYAWPGNIRELRNVLDRALLFCPEGANIHRETLHFDRSLVREDVDEGVERLADAERRHIARVLRRSGGHVDDAAKRLGLSRSSLYARLKKHGIRAHDGR